MTCTKMTVPRTAMRSVPKKPEGNSDLNTTALPPLPDQTRQALGPGKKDQNEQDHSDGVLVGRGNGDGRESLDQSEQDAAGHGAADAAEPAQRCSHDRLDRRQEA